MPFARGARVGVDCWPNLKGVLANLACIEAYSKFSLKKYSPTAAR